MISEIRKTPIKVKLLEAFKILNAHNIPIPKKGDPKITRRIKDCLSVTLLYREVQDVPTVYSTIMVDRALGYSKAGRYCTIGFDSPSSRREKFSDKGDVSLSPIPNDAKFMRWNLDDKAYELAKYST